MEINSMFSRKNDDHIFKDESLTAPPEEIITETYVHPARGGLPRARRLVDWGAVADLLAEGRDPAGIAATLGCDEARIWRNLRRSRRLRFRVEQAQQRRQFLARLRLQALAAEAVTDAVISLAAKAPGREQPLPDWLLREAGLLSDDTARAPAGLNDALIRLTALPPSDPDPKLRRRLKARQAQMDATFAKARAELDWHLARLPPEEDQTP